VAKVKVINTNLDPNLNGTNFNDFPSKTIFTFGSFNVTSNFDGKTTVDYTNTLSSFVRTVTLDTMGVSEIQSQILHDYSTKAVLNLDRSDLNTFVRFGSAYEFLRVSIQNIILAYPASLYANSEMNFGGTNTFYLPSGLTNAYDSITNVTTFYVPISSLTNTFGLVYNAGNVTIPDNNILKNLNISYGQYVITKLLEPDVSYAVVGFTGNTTNSNNGLLQNFLRFQVIGNPFTQLGIDTTTTEIYGKLSFHIKPNNIVFEEFRALLNDYERFIVSYRDNTKGFKFTLKNPTLLDDGSIVYADTNILWPTADGYNIDTNTSQYQQFLQIVLAIGSKYDQIKTDLIARFLTTTSIKTYDFTEKGKITKLLRIYGREFDQIKEFIDSLVYINKVTYDKLNNIPDQLVKNMSRTFGWDYFSLVNEEELVQSFLTVDDVERNLNEDILPAEIDVELWRRILLNTNYFWKSKGTRESIKSMFLLIGIPEPFINITEYVYTVEGKINPNTVPFAQQDFPTNSLPYDTSGYPVAPLETNNFYFQISGNSDSGQRYLDVFRMAGFKLSATVDNKKSWIRAGETIRVDDTTPQYYQEDSKLVINTKEVDIALDTARGIEYDVYKYIQEDYKANNSGYTLPYSYVNVSLNYTGQQNTFTLPYTVNEIQGDFEVRYNGILLNAPKTGATGNTLTNADYSVTGNQFTLLTENATTSGNRRDVIQATLIYTGGTQPVTGITVQYIVTRIKSNPSGTAIPLPSYPRGDLQLTINGIALTKGSSQFNADYILDPNNSVDSSQIIIQNPDVISFLSTNPEIQVAYVQVAGSNDINLRSEIVRIDSFNTSKIYFNNSANKYVYKLNYKASKTEDIKFLVDGIALEPYRDYDINVMNPFEVFLPKGLRYGTVISVYYLVGGNSVFTPAISDDFGIGDISNLSFLEFLDLVQRKMVNARNRKTISNFNGGWYPTILKIYELYMQRSLLPTGDTLHSNGYTFENLYPFLSKYNAFFQRFVDQLLSATIIVRKGGLLIRNSIFTKQKFTYKRGVNVSGVVYSTPLVTYDNIEAGNLNERTTLQYFGDDGSMFVIPQKLSNISVDTVAGSAGIGSLLNIGGENIVGYEQLTQYGMQYRILGATTWTQYPLIDGYTDAYNLSITGLTEDTTYEYRAIVIADTVSATGNTLLLKTLTSVLPVPSGHTVQNTSYSSTSLIGTGGKDIQRYSDIAWYGMQYRCVGTPDITITPTTYSSISSAGTTCPVTIYGPTWDTYTTSGNTSWITPSISVAPSPLGTVNNLTIAANSGLARSGVVKYSPLVGTPKCVTINQLGNPLYQKQVILSGCTGYPTYPDYPTCLSGSNCGVILAPEMTAGESFYATFNYHMCKPFATNTSKICAEVKCGNTVVYSCAYTGVNACNLTGTFGTKLITYNDYVNHCWNVMVCTVAAYPTTNQSLSCVSISNITNNVGQFTLGGLNSLCMQYT